MDEKNNFALVPRPLGALEKTHPKDMRILSSMTVDVAVLARENAQQQTQNLKHDLSSLTSELVKMIHKAVEDGVLEDELSATEFKAYVCDLAIREAEPTFELCREGDRYFRNKDYSEAAERYRLAAERGDRVGQSKLGQFLMTGRGVLMNPVDATKWFRKSAEQGCVEGQIELGICYSKGQGVPQDHIEAVLWFRKAAERGSAKAQNWLGVCYGKGLGVQKNDRQAFRWYRLAAELGDSTARYNLGICYLHGAGMARDTVQAYGWLKLAAERRGFSKAKEKLSVLSTSMSPGELADGEKAYEEHSKRR